MSCVTNTIVPPKQYPNYASYKALFEEQYNRLTISEPFTECGPFYGPTLGGPDRPPWKLAWSIMFPDRYYIKCVEYYERKTSGHPQEGHLGAFSYHYGLQSGRFDRLGFPRRSTSMGTLIRFDLAPDYADHLHFGGKDHIPQIDIKGGLIILDLNMFDFINQILHHRRSKEPLNECFQFEVA